MNDGLAPAADPQPFDAAPDGVCIIAPDRRVVYINPALARVFGPAAGRRCHQLLSARPDVCPHCPADSVFLGRAHFTETYFANVARAYSITGIPLRLADGAVAMLALFKEVRLPAAAQRQRLPLTDYRQLFEGLRCGVYCCTRQGQLVDVNPALIRMLGYRNKFELLGVDIAENIYLRSQDRDRFQAIILRQGYVEDFETELKRRDGRPLPVLINSEGIYDHRGDILGYQGIIIDLSRQKQVEKDLTAARDFLKEKILGYESIIVNQYQQHQMEKDLKKAHDLLDEIIRSSPSAILVTDLSHRIIIMNRAAEQTFGYSAEDAVGKMTLAQVYPEGLAETIDALLQSPPPGCTGKRASHPVAFVGRNGNAAEGTLAAAVIHDARGNEIACVHLFADMTEQLIMDRRLRQIQVRLLQAEKLAAMGRLTSQIAHELNNPLYGIMNTMELLKTEIPVDSRRRRLLDMALSETVRLTDLLRKMLSFSRPDQEEKTAVAVNTVVDEILTLNKKQLQEHGIRIVAELGQGLPEVFASRDQLRQVFLNLIANARDAMPRGGTLTVTSAATDGCVRIVVSDTGVGIAPEDLGKIFDNFYTTKEGVKGVGLGLSVCYAFIKEHNGDIDVWSRPGVGTAVTVILPAGTGPPPSL